MATIVDYASLKQAILDWSHRSDLANYIDYLIQNGQASIDRDIPDLNFGHYIQAQEASYGPFPIQNGAAPVPSDWLGPKFLAVADGQGNIYTLDFKSAAWIYDNYPQRTAAGVPAKVARDKWQASYAQAESFTATAGQTVFNLAVTPATSSVLLVSLEGAALTPGVSYTLSGDTITLSGAGASAGQTLSVQYLSTYSSTQVWTANAGQTSFQLTNSSSAVIAATLDGSVLQEGTDYTVAGGFLTLTTAATAGQTLTAYLSSGSVLVFGPYPDSGYMVQGTYYAKAPLLSASQTTNWMVIACPDCLLAACMREAAQFLKDLQMYQSWDAMYQAKLKALVDQDKAEGWSASTLMIEAG